MTIPVATDESDPSLSGACGHAADRAELRADGKARHGAVLVTVDSPSVFGSWWVRCATNELEN